MEENFDQSNDIHWGIEEKIKEEKNPLENTSLRLYPQMKS